MQAGAGRLLPSLRSRLVVLIGLAAIPVALLAAVIAWQNYRFTADQALQNVLLIRAEEAARYDAAVQGMEQMLAALSRAPALAGADTGACTRYLAGVMGLYAGRYADLVVLRPDAGPDGAVRCSTGGPDQAGTGRSRDAPWLRAAQATGRFALGSVEPSPSGGGNVISGAYPLAGPQAAGGVIVADLRLDWLATRAAVAGVPSGIASWLVRTDGTLVPLADAAAAALPPPARLQTLLDRGIGQIEARARDGAPSAYAVAPVGPHLSLLVGYRATVEARQAWDVLLGRIAELAVLLGAALIAVALGASVAVVRPVHRLSLAVARWRDGHGFDPGPVGDLPAELAELALSFAAATVSLTAQEAELKRALEHQELLMQEIHHRVKNNLQIVASLLNLQASRIRVPAAKAEFQAARDRVRALATLHRHLYAQGELHTINMRSFLIELCGQLFQAMGEKEGNRIHLEIQAPELQMLSDQAVPLSLIVTEAVSNAVKYAFPGGRRGNISVRLSSDGDVADLAIEDDGVGIPAGRAETETGPRDGIGLQLIRGFARQLGASLTVDQGNGTRYRVLMPLRRDRPAPEEAEAHAEGVPAAGGVH